MAQWEAIAPVDPAGEIPPAMAIRMFLAKDGTDIFYKAQSQTDRDEWIRHLKRFDPKEKSKGQPASGISLAPSLRSVRNDNLQDKLASTLDKPTTVADARSGLQPSPSKTEVILDKLIDTAIKHDIPGKVSRMADAVKDQMDSVQREHAGHVGSEFGGSPSGVSISSYQKDIMGRLHEGQAKAAEIYQNQVAGRLQDGQTKAADIYQREVAGRLQEGQAKAAEAVQKAAESIRKAADDLQGHAENLYSNMQSGSKADIKQGGSAMADAKSLENATATKNGTKPGVFDTFGVDPSKAVVRSGTARSGEASGFPEVTTSRSGLRPIDGRTPSKQDELRPESSTRSNRSLKEIPGASTRSIEKAGIPGTATSQTQTQSVTEARLEKLSQNAAKVKNAMMARAAELGETARDQLEKLGAEVSQLKEQISETMVEDANTGQKGIPGQKSFGTLQTGFGGMPAAVPQAGPATAEGLQHPGQAVPVDVATRAGAIGAAPATRTSLIQSVKSAAAPQNHKQTSMSLELPAVPTTAGTPVATRSKGQAPSGAAGAGQLQQGPSSLGQFQPGAAQAGGQSPGQMVPAAPGQVQPPAGAGFPQYQQTPGGGQFLQGQPQQQQLGAVNPFAQLSQQGAAVSPGTAYGQPGSTAGQQQYTGQQGMAPGQPGVYASLSQLALAQGQIGQPAPVPGQYAYQPPPGTVYQQSPPGYGPVPYPQPPVQGGYPVPQAQPFYYPQQQPQIPYYQQTPPGYGPPQPPVYPPSSYPPPGSHQQPPVNYQQAPGLSPYQQQVVQYPTSGPLPGQPFATPYAARSHEQLSPNAPFGQPLPRTASHESGLNPSPSRLSPSQTTTAAGGFDLHCIPGQPVPGQSPSFVCATTPSGSENIGGASQGRSTAPPPEAKTEDGIKELVERPDERLKVLQKEPEKDAQKKEERRASSATEKTPAPPAPTPASSSQRRATSALEREALLPAAPAAVAPSAAPEAKPEKKEEGGFFSRFRRRSSSKSAPAEKNQRPEPSPVVEDKSSRPPSQSAVNKQKDSKPAVGEKSQNSELPEKSQKSSKLATPEKSQKTDNQHLPKGEISSPKSDRNDNLMPARKTPEPRGKFSASSTKSPASSRDGARSPVSSEPEEELSLEERVRRWVESVIRTAIKESRKVNDGTPPIAVR
ncbi:uncharacterized protein LOC129590357 isoform X2 [Paramacrobiotus metropolitanus]|nr:uncharacterized protein LOC129590357 isoform X2 [Paramacrobiotus metropolitanus]